MPQVVTKQKKAIIFYGIIMMILSLIPTFYLSRFLQRKIIKGHPAIGLFLGVVFAIFLAYKEYEGSQGALD